MISKELAQQSLDALERVTTGWNHVGDKYLNVSLEHEPFALEAIEALRAAIAQDESEPITKLQAHAMGARGAKPTEVEHGLFEAWMDGHCWVINGEWDGVSYSNESESTGRIDLMSMDTRRMWAAWRDCAALHSSPMQPSDYVPLSDERIDGIMDSVLGPTTDYDDIQYTFGRAVERAVRCAPLEPYGWTATGHSCVWVGEYAQHDAEEAARHCGGESVAFALYRGVK